MASTYHFFSCLYITQHRTQCSVIWCWRREMIIFLYFVLFVLTTLYCYKKSKWKYRNLPSPGLCLPIIGHSYKIMNRKVRKDRVNGIWEIFRKYQRNGILYINTFSINCLWIGDFQTLKYVFNLPEVQNRKISEKFMKMTLQTRFASHNSQLWFSIFFHQKSPWRGYARYPPESGKSLVRTKKVCLKDSQRFWVWKTRFAFSYLLFLFTEC